MLSIFVTACSPIQASSQASLWGEVITFGQTEQISAPALWATDQRVIAAWVGADDAGVHQDAAIIERNNFSERFVLPLPPVHPFGQQILPADDGYTHLLWLDANPERENRLYAALITPTLQIERGPTLISSALTLHYAVVSDGSGGLWMVWSGGLLAEPGLYAQYIDSAGRPRQPNRIAANADWTTMARASDGTIHLFWLHPIEHQIYHAILENGNAANIDALEQAINLAPGDRIVDFQAALDTAYVYAFWNITRANGTPESWFTSTKLNSNLWNHPGRLGFGIESEGVFNTGFNGGAAKSVLSGTTWLSWAAPMTGQFDTLPVAAYRDRNLIIVYFREGVIVGYQTIGAVDVLIGAPALSTDQNRHLYLGWAEPNPAGYADLKFTTTRR
jgi:hypothetical protein